MSISAESEHCICTRLGDGVQLFRVRHPLEHFLEVADMGEDFANMIVSRKVWRCRNCDQLFALLRIPFKAEEEILVKLQDGSTDFDWNVLAEKAATLRWQGSLEGKYLI